jgi:hypothetical protein
VTEPARERGDVAAALKSGVLYFAIVFAAGFVLGALRVFFVVPWFGDRRAELLETPFMLAIAVVVARWILRRPGAPARTGGRLAMGLVALALMLAADFGLVLRLRGMTFAQYFATWDPVSGGAFLAALVMMAFVPALVGPRAAP